MAKLLPANLICPRCGNGNYMRWLNDVSKEYDLKCINCNTCWRLSTVIHSRDYDDEAPGSIEKPKKTHDNCRHGYWERDENYHLHMCELHPERIWGVEQKDCDECKEFSTYSLKSKKQTNADRIRAMSDKELAEILCAVDCLDCPLNNNEDWCSGKGSSCKESVLNWLKQEVTR